MYITKYVVYVYVSNTTNKSHYHNTPHNQLPHKQQQKKTLNFTTILIQQFGYFIKN